MNYLSLLCLFTILVGASAFAIEGRWKSIDHNNSIIAIQAVSTDLTGLNHYNLAIDECNAPLSFAILQSYMKLTNLGKQACNGGSNGALMSSLQEKFFYFQIYYDQLLLVNIYGNKSLTFERVKNDMRNYRLIGVFEGNSKDSNIIITDQSIYLCNNSLRVDYSGNSKDSVRINNSTITGQCANGTDKDILNQLQQAEYYRLQNPSVLRLYGDNYSQVLKLNKIKKWDGIVPKVSAVEDKNQSVNAIKKEDEKLNETNNKSVDTRKEEDLKNQTITISPNQNEAIINKTQTKNQNNQNKQTDKQLVTPPNNQSTTTPPINKSTATPSNNQSTMTPQNNQSTVAPPNNQSITTPSNNQSTTTLTNNQPTQSTLTPPNTQSTTTTTLPNNQSTVIPSSNQSTVTPSNNQPYLNQQIQTPSTPSGSNFAPVRPSFSIVSASWNPQYFMISDQSTWPSKIAINGSSLAFIGCQTMIVPMNIRYDNLCVTTGSAFPLSRRAACGNQDQLYVDLIRRSTSLSASANQTALKLTFFGRNNQNLFAVSRNMTAAERRNIVIDSTNPTVNIRNSSNSQPTVTNNVQTYQIPTPPVSTPTTSPIISNNNTRLTTNNTVSNTANTPPPPPAPSVRNSSVNLPTTPVVSPPTSTPPAAAVSTSILVGRYNPSRIGLTQLPAILTRNIFFIFTPTTIFVTGTCNNYVYPYNIEQRGTTTFISIDVANRLTRTGANCDASDDILYISPFEQSNQITLSSDSVTGRGANVVMSLVDRAGNPTISLNKVIVPNSS